MTDLAPDEKLCPFCAEVIKKAARKCRWCGSALPASPVVVEEQAEPVVVEEQAEPVVEVRAKRASKPREVSTGSTTTKPWVLTAVLGVALVVTLAGVGLAVKRANDSQVAPDGELASSAVRAGIMAQAGSMTTTAMSYRAAASQADIAAAEKLMTPAMRKKYEADLPPESQRAEQAKMALTIKATLASLSGSKGACRSDDCAVSIVSASQDRARVLVYVDQDATAASSKHSVASPQWELLTLVRRDGAWLIDDMTSA